LAALAEIAHFEPISEARGTDRRIFNHSVVGHRGSREAAAIVARDFFPGEARKQMDGAWLMWKRRSMPDFCG